MKTALLLLALMVGCFYLSWNLGFGASSPPEPTHNPVNPFKLAGGTQVTPKPRLPE